MGASHSISSKTQKKFNPCDYKGEWYVIAKYHTRYNRNCDDTMFKFHWNEQLNELYMTITYSSDGKLVSTRTGKACLTSESGKLLMTMDGGPSFQGTHALWIHWTDYNNYAIMGGKCGHYVWILSRKPKIPACDANMLVEKAKCFGYQPKLLLASPSVIMDTHQNNIMNVISNNEDLTTLTAAVKSTSLEKILSDGTSYTFFAPTNKAFSKLPVGILDELVANGKLTNVLSHHISIGNTVKNDLLDNDTISTLSGDDMTITKYGDTIILDNKSVIVEHDIPAKNGTIHKVDNLLTTIKTLTNAKLPGYIPSTPINTTRVKALTPLRSIPRLPESVNDIDEFNDMDMDMDDNSIHEDLVPKSYVLDDDIVVTRKLHTNTNNEDLIISRKSPRVNSRVNSRVNDDVVLHMDKATDEITVTRKSPLRRRSPSPITRSSVNRPVITRTTVPSFGSSTIPSLKTPIKFKPLSTLNTTIPSNNNGSLAPLSSLNVSNYR